MHYIVSGKMRLSLFRKENFKTKTKFFFQSDSGPNYHREVPLSEILAVDSAKKINGGELPYSFALRTANVDYFVCETPGVPSDIHSWESHIRQALQPPGDLVTMTSGPHTEAEIPEAEGGAGAAEAHQDNRDTEISQAYQIFPDEVLGSGQFGIVYGGVHRMTGSSVAIKIIDKMRFPTKQETALKNEVSILQNLQHPGVVNLEKMFETPERIFVVMEKLKGKQY